MTASEKKQLMANACKVRMGVIESTYGAKSGHPGGSLSAMCIRDRPRPFSQIHPFDKIFLRSESGLF